MHKRFSLLGLSLLAACGSSTSGPTCGDGTTLENGMCVATGSGSGNDTTCGTGTHLEGTMCVPDAPAAHGAPTITMMTPTETGVTGNGVFQIQGTNFAGDDITDLHVYFGDTTAGQGGQLGPCEAIVAAASETFIGGQIPEACDLNVQVSVVTNKGSATTAFHYDAVYAADGVDSDFGAGGYLWLMDPFAGFAYGAAPLVDAANNTYNVDGLAFATDGTLYGVTTGTSQGDTSGLAQLVTIAPSGQAVGTVTVIGSLVDASNNIYIITDIKMSGTTLYGWAYQSTDGVSLTNQMLVTISTTDGTVTPVGAGAAISYGVGGLAVDGTGTVYVAANGADSQDTNLTATGSLDTANVTTGALTSAATMDYGLAAPIEAMTFLNTASYGSFMFAAIDDSEYGGASGLATHGVTFALIDPTGANGVVSPWFEMPAFTAEQSHISAIDVPPSTLTIQRTLQAAHGHWTRLVSRR